MRTADPTPELDPRFSSPGVAARPWSESRSRLDEAEIYWLSSVRGDGRPHVTPVAAIWIDDAIVFGTGPDERKAMNLAANPHCVVTTGTNQLGHGLDVVVEGDAVRMTNVDRLRAASAAFIVKYAGVFRYEVRDDGSVAGGGGEVLLFRVAPQKAFGFWRDGGFSQTRWRFEANR